MSEQDFMSHISKSYDIDYNKEKIGIAALFLLLAPNEKEPNIAARKDYDDFKKLLVDMRFEVKEYERTGLNEVELKQMLESDRFTKPYPGAYENARAAFKAAQIACIRDDILEDHSCFIAMFFGHGGPGYIKSDGDDIDIHKDILPKFFPDQCLNGKPKIFIFQACRGQLQNIGEGKGNSNELSDAEIPASGSDMLLCYSAWNNFVSYVGDDPNQGTPYLQTLHKLLRKYGDGHFSFTDILTAVSRQVSQNGVELWYKGIKQDAVGVQMPCFESSLREKLFLKVNPPAPTHQAVTSDM